VLVMLILQSAITDAAEQVAKKAAVNTSHVHIRPPSSYVARKLILFPLDLPSYLTYALIRPLEFMGRYVEENHVVEKIVDILSNDERTFWIYPILEGSEGLGLGGGVAVTHKNLFNRGYKLDIKGLLFDRIDHRLRLYLSNPNLYELVVDWSDDSDADFYGLGNGSLEGDLTNFSINNFKLGGGLILWSRYGLSVKPHVYFIRSIVRGSIGAEEPSIETRFPLASLTGFDQRLIYLNYGIRLAYDTRDSEHSPESGGIRSFTFQRFEGLDRSGFNFYQYELNVRQFFRLWRARRVFVLANSWVFQQVDGANSVPFYRLTKLDQSTPLRGFDQGRFRDRNSVLFNAEYRYPIWDFIDGTLFFDYGQVFRRIAEVNLDDFQYSVGGGFRFRSAENFFLRVQLGYGGEGVNLAVGASTAL